MKKKHLHVVKIIHAKNCETSIVVLIPCLSRYWKCGKVVLYLFREKKLAAQVVGFFIIRRIEQKKEAYYIICYLHTNAFPCKTIYVYKIAIIKCV